MTARPDSTLLFIGLVLCWLSGGCQDRPMRPGNPAPARPAGPPPSAPTPLPEGAEMRLGGAAFTHGGTSKIYGPMVAFSPTGAYLATVSDATVRVWNPTSGALLRTVVLDPADASGIAFAGDGNTLVIGSNVYGRMHVLDVSTGAVRTIPKARGRISDVDASVDKSMVATSGYGGSVRLWDLRTDSLIHEWRGDVAVESIGFSASSPGGGPLLASASESSRVDRPRDGVARLWDVASKRQRREFTVPGHGMDQVALSADGSLLATGDRSDTVIRVWDTRSGELLRSLDRPSQVLEFAPHGTTLASSDGKSIHVWNAETGSLEREFAAGPRTGSLAFSPDGAVLAAAGGQPAVHLWTLATGKPVLARRGHAMAITSVASSPDGRTLATASEDGTIRLWQRASGEELSVLTGHRVHPGSLRFDDGDSLTYLGGEEKGGFRRFELWRTGVARGSSAQSWDLDFVFEPDYRPESIALSPDGTIAAVGGARGDKGWTETLRLVQVGSGDPMHVLEEGHESPVSAVVFSPDGKRVAADYDGVLSVFDVASGERVCGLDTESAWGLRFLPDSQAIAVARTGGIALWDARSCKRLRSLEADGVNYANEVRIAISPDGVWLAASGRERIVRVWNVQTAKLSRRLGGHDGVVTALRFVDDTTLTSGSDDTTVLLWRLSAD